MHSNVTAGEYGTEFNHKGTNMTEVQDWRKNPRVSKNSIPNTESKCTFSTCSYCKEGKCPSPRENKKHKDAICHKLYNKEFAPMFNIGD